jgi:hypothetical protein
MGSCNLPYEIIYKIFNHVEHYTTAKHFLTLDKNFYTIYGKTDKFRLRILSLLFKYVVDFIYSTLEMSELEFRIIKQTASERFKKDVIFVYNAISTAIDESFSPNLTDKSTFIHSIITSHHDFLLNSINIKIQNSKVKIVVPSKSELLLYKPRYPFRYLKTNLLFFKTTFF